MHPADQVVAFSELARSGATVAAIAARFGVTERLVEQRLRLGNAAPELLDAYRAETIDLDTLKAFAVTTDHDRQRAVFEQTTSRGYRPTAWQVKRLLTEERVPAGVAVARFVGVDAYEAAGGPVLRDLFADEHENGVWLEDPKLLTELATRRLAAAAAELSTRWKWAQAVLEVDWSATARYGRIHPEPSTPTDAESAELEKLRTRHDELATLDEHKWTDELIAEGEAIEARLEAIELAVDERATFRAEDFAMAGCIATVGRDGTLQVIQGLVKPEDMPKEPAGTAHANTRDADTDGAEGATVSGSRVDAPALSTPIASPPDPRTKAREQAGVGIGLADDLRAIRTALVKAHLANDFEAAFDLVVFQMVRAVFARGYARRGTSFHSRLTVLDRDPEGRAGAAVDARAFVADAASLLAAVTARVPPRLPLGPCPVVPGATRDLFDPAAAPVRRPRAPEATPKASPKAGPKAEPEAPKPHDFGPVAELRYEAGPFEGEAGDTAAAGPFDPWRPCTVRIAGAVAHPANTERSVRSARVVRRSGSGGTIMLTYSVPSSARRVRARAKNSRVRRCEGAAVRSAYASSTIASNAASWRRRYARPSIAA